MLETEEEKKKARQERRRKRREDTKTLAQTSDAEEEGREDTQAKEEIPEKQSETLSKKESEETNFQKLCFDVSLLLKTERGRMLNCKLKVLVEERTAVIYQGLLSNVWGRLNATGNHNIYRNPLLQLLKNDPKVEKHFK